jgi:hypothetical protein
MDDINGQSCKKAETLYLPNGPLFILLLNFSFGQICCIRTAQVFRLKAEGYQSAAAFSYLYVRSFI